jgi:hypothetical protein
VIQRVYLATNQSPTTPTTQKFEGSSQIHKEKEGKNTRTKSTQNFSRKKLSKRVEPTLWMDPTTLPLNSKVKITNTDTISKHMWISTTLGMNTRVSKC